jgi:hypothetical protein
MRSGLASAWSRSISIASSVGSSESPEPKPAFLDLSPAHGSSSTHLTLSIGVSLETQVRDIEKRLANLVDEVGCNRRAVSESLDSVQREMADRIESLETERQRREDREREFKKLSVALNLWGTLLFAIGTALSLAANLISPG